MLVSRDSCRSRLKTPPLPLPGQSVRERITLLQTKIDDVLLLPFVSAVLAMFECWRWWVEAPPNPIFLTLVMIITALYAWKKILPIKSMITKLRLGEEGERAVGQMLEQLREKGYRVFHDIPGSGFNIDHVIVGPAGIFTIETKTRSKPKLGRPRIVYNGNVIRIENGRSFEKPLEQARGQARWLVNLLNDGRTPTFTVRPIVVFPEWYVQQMGSGSQKDVWVLNPKALDKFLDHEPQTLSPSLVELAANALTRYCRQSVSF